MSTAATLSEQIVLLSLDDETGRPVGRAGMAPDFALAGAALMDLALAGRIDTDRNQVMVLDTTPTGDRALDGALAAIAAPGAPTDARGLILLLARDAGSVREALLARLVAAGLLRQHEGRVFLLFTDRRFPKAPGRVEATDARARLRDLLLREDLPEPQDALLLGLARAAGLLPLFFTAAELSRVQPWLDIVTRIESLNRSLGAAVADLRAAGLHPGHPPG